MRTLAPIVEWLPAYRRAWLSRDLVAGAAAWAVLVPLGLAYSGILGVDPVIGLYTLPLPLVAYAVFGGSRLFVVGPDAAVVVLASATADRRRGGGGPPLADPPPDAPRRRALPGVLPAEVRLDRGRHPRSRPEGIRRGRHLAHRPQAGPGAAGAPGRFAVPRLSGQARHDRAGPPRGPRDDGDRRCVERGGAVAAQTFRPPASRAARRSGGVDRARAAPRPRPGRGGPRGRSRRGIGGPLSADGPGSRPDRRPRPGRPGDRGPRVHQEPGGPQAGARGGSDRRADGPRPGAARPGRRQRRRRPRRRLRGRRVVHGHGGAHPGGRPDAGREPLRRPARRPHGPLPAARPRAPPVRHPGRDRRRGHGRAVRPRLPAPAVDRAPVRARGVGRRLRRRPRVRHHARCRDRPRPRPLQARPRHPRPGRRGGRAHPVGRVRRPGPAGETRRRSRGC